ncbi:class I SAM-dependent RNA methyltransferase [Candidatus Saccharibacteria bacterium]|nr:class I SAM-dependent RNA methyltransferase [Candidatus Saccharibacteria bacterium]MBR3138950.1 class I SAM-dependent RNA methyltransferase [Candidatus Saccharibacteria bacterium]
MVKVEKFIPGGQSLGELDDGKKIFFWNALPGELVLDYKITKNKSHYVEAIATSIDNQSIKRTNPKDECFLSTSPWQILQYDYELKVKQELIKEMFREHSIIIDTPDIVTDNKDYFYRNKMEYALYWDNKNNSIKPAFHSRGSHYKIPINQSSLERPEIFQKTTSIINDLNKKHEEARRYQSLLLRCNQKGEVSGGLYENNRPHPSFNTLSDTILGYQYSYSPNGFFQINLPVYEMALKEIKQHISTQKVLDLYSGVGTIGLSVARDLELTLVECDKHAFNELEKNVKQAKPNNHITTSLAKSEAVTEYITPNQTVIIDPPRAGCDTKLIEKLNQEKPDTIIYLSCNPITQARDAKILLDNYSIKLIKAYNFFPHTPHIENLLILKNKS